RRLHEAANGPLPSAAMQDRFTRRHGAIRYSLPGTMVFSPNPNGDQAVLEGMSDTVAMDQHTLELLEVHKVRELLASYAACSLGKELARTVEPIADVEKIRTEIALVSEMSEALGAGQTPPFGGLHDVRLLVRRAAIGSMLSAEQLLEVADTLACTGNVYRYRARLDPRLRRRIQLLAASAGEGG